MFMLMGLPRSRTKWLSEFLTYGSIRCYHERLSQLPSIADLSTMGDNGSAETFATSVWAKVYDRFPDARYVVIKRDPAEVERSLAALGYRPPVREMAKTLNAAEKGLPCLSIQYHEINDRLREIWEWCREDEFPAERAAMTHERIVCDLPEMLRSADLKKLWRMRWLSD